MSLIYELPGELAYHGHRVKVYDTNAEALRKAKEELETQKEELRRDELMLVADFVVRKQNKPQAAQAWGEGWGDSRYKAMYGNL